ncbi:NADH pyrophosphatase-like protein [Gracilaria domingensis]|nr:NADH pyrophosphatase-like protein [Gracilaria domingensis]
MPPSQIPDLKPCTFGGPSLNRLNNHRRNSETDAKITDPRAKHLIFNSQLKVLVRLLNGSASLALLPATTCGKLPVATEDPILLGVDAENIPYVALRLPALSDEHESNIPPDTKFIHLRSAFPGITGVHAAISAHARSLLVFHERHQFCGQCGARTKSEQAGARRRCIRNVLDEVPPETRVNDESQCGGMWFPRTDPVVIMLVLDSSGKSTLLGRQSRFPPGLYSCLAGFMEHGEGIEDAVRREVFEEAGVRVGRVRFFTSQPWPFPYSLMLGCVAQADSKQISIDPHELEHARWFSREEIVSMMACKRSRGKNIDRNDTDDENNNHVELFVPPTATIAGKLLETFASREPITLFDPKAGGML